MNHFLVDWTLITLVYVTELKRMFHHRGLWINMPPPCRYKMKDCFGVCSLDV